MDSILIDGDSVMSYVWEKIDCLSAPDSGDRSDQMFAKLALKHCRQYSSDYAKDEEEAKSAHRGIWQGKFEIPADWRKENKGKKGGNNSAAASKGDSSKGSPISRSILEICYEPHTSWMLLISRVESRLRFLLY